MQIEKRGKIWPENNLRNKRHDQTKQPHETMKGKIEITQEKQK